MKSNIPIEHGHFYHIYNHGVGGRNLFFETVSYKHFLELYDKYIDPVAETYAWCLMPNHFHLLVRIKEDNKVKTLYELNQIGKNIKTSTVDEAPIDDNIDSNNKSEWKTKKPTFSKQLGHLCNSHAHYINKKYNQRGNLFERPFKRKLIGSEAYLKQMVLYIHNNPVHHGFCSHPIEYPWSSYLTCISDKPTKLHRKEVIDWFNDAANFEYMHKFKVETDKIEQWLEL